MEYPTRKGISIPLTELSLPKSRLDPFEEKNYNNHHNEWTARQMGRFFLFLTLRNLASSQCVMPLDVHEYIHQNYDPPKMPTPIQAMTEVERAYDAGEKLRYGGRRPTFVELSSAILIRCIESYNQCSPHRHIVVVEKPLLQIKD